jgi:hypothetical protein
LRVLVSKREFLKIGLIRGQGLLGTTQILTDPALSDIGVRI